MSDADLQRLIGAMQAEIQGLRRDLEEDRAEFRAMKRNLGWGVGVLGAVLMQRLAEFILNGGLNLGP